MDDYIGGDESEMNSQIGTILFRTGSEHLICHVEDDHEKGIKHVYLRNIELGFG